MKLIKIIFIYVGFLFLIGCVTTPKEVQLTDNFWKEKKKIIITKVKSPEPQVYQVGTQGLLDIAIAAAMNRNLDKHLSTTTDLTWYQQMPTSFHAQLKKRGINSVIHSDFIDNDKPEN